MPRGVNESATSASYSARLRGDPSKSMRCAAIGRIGVTRFAAGLESCSHRSDAVAKRFSFFLRCASRFQISDLLGQGVPVCCDERSQAAVTRDRSPIPHPTDTSLASVQPRVLSDKLPCSPQPSAVSPLSLCLPTQ